MSNDSVAQDARIPAYVIVDTEDPERLTPFQRVPEPKIGKNRVHIDMFVDDLDAGTARVEELGGRWTEPGSTVEDGRWLSRVMADPEGNEFCICLVHPDVTR